MGLNIVNLVGRNSHHFFLKKYLYITMKIFKKILPFIFILLFTSCQVAMKTTYPKNSVWWYYDGVNDSTKVYINHYSLIEGIIVRDTQMLNDSSIIGSVKKYQLFPYVSE
jgi:hypothetical protein